MPKKNKATIDNFVLENHLTNIVIELEIQNCKNVLALDRDSHSDKSKNLDIRNHFGFGQMHICDYMPFNEESKKFTLIEKSNLTNKFNGEIYEKDQELLVEIFEKIRDSLDLVFEVLRQDFIKVKFSEIKFNFIFIIEGNEKEPVIFYELARDIAKLVKENFNMNSEIMYAIEFYKYHRHKYQ